MTDEGGKKPSSGLDDTIPATTPPERSSVPTIPGPPDTRYRLGQELGRGGMGRVVEAFDTHLGRTVALKEVLPKGSNIDRRFQREVRITARLEHASIVPLYDSGRLADGRPFYVMRRVSGRPLDEVITRARDLEGRLALLPNVLSAIDAIAHAHTRGVIHRDVKPQNILVGELGETVVIDWGLAKVIGDSDDPPDSLEPRLPSPADSLQTQVGSVFGTPGFMAPEQARGDDLGPAGDVYALGATLYQMLVGRPPFAGSSATDVISSTLRHRIEPVARACPSAPAELVTIIEKALAFEPTDRYANAGELAADVRRFLTGQLVAAHRYTPRQRIARFARRHRAALVVAALASVGLAVVAWVAVHRVVRERDVAEEASLEARAERAKADQRAAEIRERADQLLLLRARGLLDTSPTEAIAVIKQIEGSGAVIEEAKAVARAAVMRGVAWGVPTLPEITVSLEITGDGKRLVQVNRFGALQIIDLDHRRVIATRKLPLGSSALWIDHDRKLLLQRTGDAPVIYDPVTQTEDTLAVSEPENVSATADGERLAMIDREHQLVLVDVASKRVTPVPGRAPRDRVLFAPDGSWIAMNENIDAKHQRLIVIDPGGRVLAQHDGMLTVMGASSTGKLAVGLWEGVYEVVPLAPTPVFARLPLDKPELPALHHLMYRDDALYLLTQQSLLRWTGKLLVRARDFPDGSLLAYVGKDGVIAAASLDGRIHLLQQEISHVLTVPSRGPGITRIATATGASRLVATSKDALMVWDLDRVLPRRAPMLSSPYFANESTLVSPAGVTLQWEWWDIDHGTQKTAQLHTDPGMARDVDITPTDGRVMVVIEHSEDQSAAVVGSLDGSQQVIDGVSFGLARLVPGNAVVYSTGKGRVIGQVGREPPRELLTVDGTLTSLSPWGTLGYAALSEHGELVRGRFDGGDFVRIQVPDVTMRSFVVAALDGSLLVANGNRLLRADGTTLEELARFKTRIDTLVATPSGLAIHIAGGDTLFMPAKGDHTPRTLAVAAPANLAPEGSRIISINSTNQVEVIELPSLATWTLPHLFSPMPRITISPSGRRIYQGIGADAALWQVPEPASDFPAWLDEQTNAIEGDSRIHWPWQQPSQ